MNKRPPGGEKWQLVTFVQQKSFVWARANDDRDVFAPGGVDELPRIFAEERLVRFIWFNNRSKWEQHVTLSIFQWQWRLLHFD